MKRYLLYFLCLFLCVALTPTVFSLMPESFKSHPGHRDAFAEGSGQVPQAGGFPENVKLIDTLSGETVIVSLENYVAGVLSTEMPLSAPAELLKTMAVVVRTYAVYHILRGDKHNKAGDLCTDPKHCRGFTKRVEDEGILAAVKATEGKIICHNGYVIDPLTHISSSGRTESAESVFGTAVPYLISVETPDESVMTSFYEQKEFSKKEFSAALARAGFEIDEDLKLVNWISYISYTPGGRVKSIHICGHEISGALFATLFSLKSTKMTVDTGENGFIIATEGIGHGVGLSLYGAWLLAEAGNSYNEIIVHYFSGAYITQN